MREADAVDAGQAPGAPSFIELGVPAGSRARRFYGDVFGWTFTDMGKDNFLARTPTLEVGVHTGDADAVFVVYFLVDDLEAAVARVRAAGGTADDPGPEQPGFGRFAECRDDQGVRFGLRQLTRAL
ncbi:MAG TPA: VOC family protein [Kofleriaceae bacterium]|nr:VOC family protein [Kofleriaceae bacterium]